MDAILVQKTVIMQLNCIEYQSAYFFVHINPNKWSLKEIVVVDNSIFSDSKGQYYSCSDNRYHSVEKCLYCKNKENCELCQNGYALYNSKTLCLSYSDINEHKYYFDPTNNAYSLCSKEIKGCEKM